MGDQERVAPIDGLRAIAALSVAWFHIYAQNGGMPLIEAMPDALNLASVRGRFGVQLFFAISGFVITYRLLNDRSISRPVDVGIYFLRRSVRLDPTYWFALSCYLIGVPLIIVLGGPHDVFPPQLLNVPEVVANIFYFLPFASLLYVPVAWSLVVEVQFYFLFAALVLILNRLEAAGFDRAQASTWLGFALIAAMIPYLFSLHAQDGPSPTVYHYLFNFLGGILLAMAHLKVPQARWLVATYVLAMCTAALFHRNSYIIASLLSVGLIALGLAWGPVSRTLSLRPLLYVGALSYCIYLFHPLIGGLAIEILQRVISDQAGPHQLLFVVGGMLATIGFSVVIYRAIEKPSIAASKWIRTGADKRTVVDAA